MKASSLLSSYLDSSDDEASPSTRRGNKATKKVGNKSQSFLASILLDSSDEEKSYAVEGRSSEP